MAEAEPEPWKRAMYLSAEVIEFANRVACAWESNGRSDWPSEKAKKLVSLTEAMNTEG